MDKCWITEGIRGRITGPRMAETRENKEHFASAKANRLAPCAGSYLYAVIHLEDGFVTFVLRKAMSRGCSGFINQLTTFLMILSNRTACSASCGFSISSARPGYELEVARHQRTLLADTRRGYTESNESPCKDGLLTRVVGGDGPSEKVSRIFLVAFSTCFHVVLASPRPFHLSHRKTTFASHLLHLKRTKNFCYNFVTSSSDTTSIHLTNTLYISSFTLTKASTYSATW